MEYDEFKEKYVDHIEGRAENTRNRGDDSDDGEDAGAHPASANKKSADNKATSSQMNVTGRSSSHAGNSKAPASR